MTDIFERLRSQHGALYRIIAILEEKDAEIQRLREALRYYANKKQEEWVNVTGADDGVVARAALGEKER